MRRFLLLPLLLIVASCAQISGDKYPLPTQFVTTEDVCPCELGAPPAVGSPTQKKEINRILAIQAKLTEADKAAIANEDSISVEKIVAPVLGKGVTREAYPALFTLLDHVQSDAWRVGDATQEFWNRKRPWVEDTRVHLLVKPITRPGYPSGHSTTNHVWAGVLAELFPTKKEALFARAHEIGMSRVKGGVHYPSDVQAGKRLAARIVAAMHGKAQFKAELAAAKAELAVKKPKATVLPLHRAANDNTPLPRGYVAACSNEPGAMKVCH